MATTYTFGIIDNRIVLGKESIAPICTELHYFRVEKKYWSICFERIKRTGIRIVSTPIPWNLHQDKNKEVDFAGFDDSRKDLVVFLELARELGFKVILRPGPYIGPDWPNGGIPEFVTSDLRTLARDHNGSEKPLVGVAGVKGGYQVSYLSSAFQTSMRLYFKQMVNATRNYAHPRGPVIMIELDHEPSFGGVLDPGGVDYNLETVTKHFPSFLAGRYGELKKLNSLYHKDFKDWETIEPPRVFAHSDHKKLPAIFDWFRFKEDLVNQYLETVDSQFESYAVSPLRLRALKFQPKALLPMYRPGPPTDSRPIGSGIGFDCTHADIERRARYLRGRKGLVWATSYPSGRASEDPATGEKLRPVTDGERRGLLASSIGSGFKAFTLEMFVDHERWYGAPLKSDGSVTSGYQFVKRLGESVDTLELSTMTTEVKVAVIGNRLYQWFASLPQPTEFAYIHRLVNETMPNLCRDLTRLKIEYDIIESDALATLTGYALVIAPSAEFMSAAEQDALLELTRHGIAVTLVGVAPRLDENMATCANLANFFHIRTTNVSEVAEVTVKDSPLYAHVYGHLKTTDTKAKKMASAGKEIVGLLSNKRPGHFTFFTFDITASGDHHRLLFLESFLRSHKIEPVVYVSDPLVDASICHNEKRAIVTLVAPPPGEMGERVETRDRDVFIRVDLKKIGFKSPNIKIHDLLDATEPPPALKVTSADLADGIPLRISYPDGKILVIEKRA